MDRPQGGRRRAPQAPNREGAGYGRLVADLCVCAALSWQAALDLTPSQAQAVLAAAGRRDTGKALLAMRINLAAAAALHSKAGQRGYRKMEKELESLSREYH